MAKLVYALNQSLDGLVDHDRFAPDAVLFRHFIDDVRSLAGSIYGRRMYETMRYWDEQHDEWGEPERDYAKAWRAMPKWVVSTSLHSVGPNATLIDKDMGAAVAGLKARIGGLIEVSGPQLAAGLSDLRLIDEYRIYLHPVVLGEGRPYFAGLPPPLRLLDEERIGENVIRLTYILA